MDKRKEKIDKCGSNYGSKNKRAIIVLLEKQHEFETEPTDFVSNFAFYIPLAAVSHGQEKPIVQIEQPIDKHVFNTS